MYSACNNIPIDDIIEFAGSRMITSKLLNFAKNSERVLHGAFYRGMPFPKHLLQEGLILEEWHNSCHWTTNLQTAFDFAVIKRNGYINEDYYSELANELQTDYVEFVQLILKTDRLTGIDLYKILSSFNITDYESEKEITTFGKMFKVINICSMTINDEEIYLADIEEI